jgi:TonB-linked SusC/RagA family outer membrane protein
MGKYLLSFLALLFLNLAVSAQTKTVTGTVSASGDGNPLAGVSVMAKGTVSGTVTNSDGYYVLQIPAQSEYLVFSYVGMKTAELSVDSEVVNAVLEPDLIGLSEVVIVAYGAAQRQQFTGSVSTVRSEQLERFQSADFSGVLQGLSTGVYTAGGSGQPGEGDDIRIRGFSTFGNASPLIVLDGFPYDGKMNAIPLSDIESVTVLKDAPATALYGSRAANGVIIVTTKQGNAGSSGLDVKMNYGLVDRAISGYETVSPSQYYEMQWEGLKYKYTNQINPPADPAKRASEQLVPTLGGYNAFNVPDNELIGSDGKINPNARLLWQDNWKNEAINTGKRQEITLNAHGGSSKSKYFLSGSVLDEEGIIKASGFKRYSARANVSSRLTDYITAGVHFSGSLSEQNYPESGATSLLNPFRVIELIAPIYPVYLYAKDGILQTDDTGEKLYDFGTEYGRARPYGFNQNVLGTLELDERLYKNDVFTVRSFIDFELAKGLTFKSSLSADHYTFTGLTHQNMRYGSGRSFNGRTNRETWRTFSYTANQMLQFTRALDEHTLQAFAAHENYSYKFNMLTATRSGFQFPDQVELDGASVSEGSGSYEDNYRIESYFGKIDYAYNDRYFASFNFRSDGNSRFAKDVRWGNFWGAGLAWLLSEEEFTSGLNWLSLLKLKASYGEQGNDKIGSYYGYQGLYQMGMNNIDYPGAIASRIATPDLTWEALRSFNVGAELAFNERFALNFEYYIRENNDLLFEKPLPLSTGFPYIDANVARLSNKGIDMGLKGLLVNTQSLIWLLEVNLGHFKNEIRELPQDFIITGNKRWEVGRSIYDFYIEEYAGVNPETGISQWYYNVPVDDASGNPVLDADGNPVYAEERGITENYNNASRYYAGSAIPDLFGGVNNTLSFWGFDLSVLATFGLGGKVFDNPYQNLMHTGLPGYNLHTDILNSWTTDNPNTDVPVFNGDQLANRRSTRFLVNADYLTLRNANLGYQIPETLVTRVNIKSIKLNLKADNLFILTARKGLVPMQSFEGSMQTQYVPVRTVSLGFDVRF